MMQTIWRPYGVAAVVDGVTLRTRDVNRDLVTSDILVDGDVVLSKSGGAASNLLTLPVQSPPASGLWRVQLSPSEMTSPAVSIRFIDQSGTKAFSDDVLNIETYGNNAAQHGVDFTEAGQTFNAQLLVGTATDRTVSVSDAISRYAARSWYMDFLIVGEDSSGWNQFAFSLKRFPDQDSDDESALIVRKSNPSTDTDGVVRFLGQPATGIVTTWATLNVTDAYPTNVVVHVLPPATDLPPGAYAWELARYRDGDADTLGAGVFTVLRGVRRTPVAP